VQSDSRADGEGTDAVAARWHFEFSPIRETTSSFIHFESWSELPRCRGRCVPALGANLSAAKRSWTLEPDDLWRSAGGFAYGIRPAV